MVVFTLVESCHVLAVVAKDADVWPAVAKTLVQHAARQLRIPFHLPFVLVGVLGQLNN